MFKFCNIVSLCCIIGFFPISFEFPDDGKPTLVVGALFFADESDIELSFDEAFREINNNKLFEVNFKTIKRYLASDDSLILQQLTCELLASDVAAIFGPSSKATSDIVAIIANATGVPHVNFDMKIESYKQQERHHKMSINLAPHPPLVSQAYFDIIKNFQWEIFTIIYDTEAGLARLQNLMSITTLNRDVVKLRDANKYKDDYRVLFKDVLENFHEYRIILDCEPDTLKELLTAALDFKLLGSFRHWFLTHLDTHSSKLSEIYNAAFKANITSVRIKTVEPNPFAKKKTRITRIDELYANQTMLPLLIYDAVVLFANSARNIIHSLNQYRPHNKRCVSDRGFGNPWPIGQYILREMKTISEDDVEPNFKTENMQFDDFGRRIGFNLEIFKPTVNEPLAVWTPKGEIKPITALQEFKQASSDTEDFSAAKKFFTVVTRYEEPYFMLKEDQENFRGLEKFEGYAVDLIQKLSEIMDFDYDFTIASGSGKYNPDTKEWDGMIRKLIDHQAEIGIADLTITQSRRKVVDFTVPFMQLGISILYYNSPPEPKDIFAFLKPFAPEVWLYMALAQLLITISFVFIARLSQSEWEAANPADPSPTELENKWNTSNSFWLMIGSIMQQGCDILPRAGPMRMLTSMWWFFALMMLSTYTANLAAFLTMEKNQITINSLTDLVEQDKVKFGTSKGGSTSMFFSESNDTEYSKVWNQMKGFVPSALTDSTKEGVERVAKEKGGYAFLMETTTLSYNVERNCFLKQIGSQIGEKHYALAVPLGASYRSNLSVSLLQLSEKGELYRLKKRWWKNHNVTCPKYHELDGDELSIIELGGVFFVLIGGVILSYVLGILEFLWNVERIAVEQRVTLMEAFKAELLFVVKFWIKRKPVLINCQGSLRSKSLSRRSSITSKISKSQSFKSQK